MMEHYYSSMCSSLGGWWDESFPRTPSYREVTPAQPVTINLDQALARDNPSLRTTNPLRVSAGGLRLTGYCPGRLHALGQAEYRHLDGGMHVHRAQRQPPGSTGAAAMVARQLDRLARALDADLVVHLTPRAHIA